MIPGFHSTQEEYTAYFNAGGCRCWKCMGEANIRPWWFVVCVKCGCKRCPHCRNHENDCTNSNEPDQKGSAE